MSTLSILPIQWSLEQLTSYDNDALYGLACQAAGTLTSARLLLGRCLLVGHVNGLFDEHGCSGAVHFARLHLKMGRKVALDCLRVARALETLPLLRRAAESGNIAWCMLREVVRKATADTEALWIELCFRCTNSEIEDLVECTSVGDIPQLSMVREGLGVTDATELRFNLSPEALAVFQRGLQALCQAEGKMLTPNEALEYAFAGVLAEFPLDEDALKAARREASKDVQAEETRKERLVREARALAEEMGIRGVASADGGDWGDDRVGGGVGGKDDHPVVCDGRRDTRAGSAVDHQDTCAGGGVGHGDDQVVTGETGTTGAETLGDEVGATGPGARGAETREKVDVVGRADADARGAETRDDVVVIGRAGAAIDDYVAMSGLTETAFAEEVAGDSAEGFGGRPIFAATVPARAREDEEFWSATTAVDVVPCPTDSRLGIAMRDRPAWRNDKLRYNEKARGLTRAQRRDLLRRDGYCCSVPGCTNHLWLEAHHKTLYRAGGATSPWNVLFLCTRCHTDLHAGRLFITGCPELGTLVFRDARGRRLGECSALERAAWLDHWYGWTGSEEDSRALKLFRSGEPLGECYGLITSEDFIVAKWRPERHEAASLGQGLTRGRRLRLSFGHRDDGVVQRKLPAMGTAVRRRRRDALFRSAPSMISETNMTWERTTAGQAPVNLAPEA